ncbi:GNAT family N-acetyltransferase [Salinarimonas sp.]|uniref:GNAT family N-acetyltransferase n=1 Tax=Salinarimonas sp. TaxID=2766526 RepID=UPI0032D8FA98
MATREGRTIRLDLRPLTALATDAELRAAWADLLHRAADPNPFYGPDFLVPLVETCARAPVSCAVVIETRGAAHPRLLAFLPLVAQRPIPLVRPRLLAAFTHAMAVDSTPLLDGEDPLVAAEGLLAALALHAPGARLRLPLLAQGATRDALAAALRACGGAEARLGMHERAALVRPEPPDARPDPLAGLASAKYLSKLRRLERRLAEEGDLAARTLAGPDAEAGVEALLALEGAGWKGAAGTALASRADTTRFARDALTGAAQAPRIVVDLLAVGGAPVAADLHLVAGARAATFKTAYDEARAKTSPGMLLHARVARETRAGRFAERVDSCAVPGHPVEALWTDRIAFSDTLIDPAPGADGRGLAREAARLARVEALLHTGKARAKRLLGRRETALRPREAG